MKRILTLCPLINVLVTYSSIFCADFTSVFEPERFREAEIINERSTDTQFEMVVVLQENLSPEERKIVLASGGFVFDNGATRHKIQNMTEGENNASIYLKKKYILQPWERTSVILPGNCFVYALNYSGILLSCNKTSRNLVVVVKNDDFISPKQEELNKRYVALEGELALCCHKPEFDYPELNLSQNQAVERNCPENIILKPLKYSHALPAFEDAVLISMVKDEADIIFENLCFHFYMGFRKFVIIDNGSGDDTHKKIGYFKDLAARQAEIAIIKDDRVLYAQSSRMNAINKMAEEIFPSVKWIFPNDADEFIIFDVSIQDSLAKIAENVNCIHVPRITYIPTESYFSYSAGKKFYEKLYRAHKRNPYDFPDNGLWNGKSFIKAHKGMLLVKGNHFAATSSDTIPNYISGLEAGIHIREYPLRSPEHALRKIINMGKAHIELRKLYPNLTGYHYADDRYNRYLSIGDPVGEEEFRKFIQKGSADKMISTSFEESFPLGNYVDFVISSLRDFNFLPELNLSFIFYEKLYAEQEVAKQFVAACQKLGMKASIANDHSNQDSNQVLDICMTGAPWDDFFKYNPSKYSYMYSHVNTAAMCNYFSPADKRYKFFMQVGKNCSLPNFSLYGRKKGFYFTKLSTEFSEPNIEDASIFFCGGGWDSRYLAALSTLDQEPFFNWYGGKDVSSKKSYKGFAENIIEAIKKHGIAITLHSRHHLENSEPSARIFEAAASGAVIISDRHPFIVENFNDSVLYINQNDTEEKIAEDIKKHYHWIKANPQLAIEKARRSHRIFVDQFTAEDQILKIVQMHQETLILDGLSPLMPRSDFSYTYDKSSIKGLNQLLQTTYFQHFTVQNLTDKRIDNLIRLQFIKRIGDGGETLNSSNGIFFIRNDGEKTSQLVFSRGGELGDVHYANCEMGHEIALEAGTTRTYNFLGKNIYLNGFFEKPFITSYEVRWWLNNFEVILR